jgi:selenocysteine lyase/cysteine desulfurase
MGTPQYELLAGLSATVAYFAELGALCGGEGDIRALIKSAYDAQRHYEEPLTNQLIDGLQAIPGVTIYGITNPNRIAERVTTVSFRHTTHAPEVIAKSLAQSGIHVWHGHNYAYEPAHALNLPLDEGVVRIGLAHYNTQSEVEHTLEEITKSITKAG